MSISLDSDIWVTLWQLGNTCRFCLTVARISHCDILATVRHGLRSIAHCQPARHLQKCTCESLAFAMFHVKHSCAFLLVDIARLLWSELLRVIRNATDSHSQSANGSDSPRSRPGFYTTDLWNRWGCTPRSLWNRLWDSTQRICGTAGIVHHAVCGIDSGCTLETV